MPADTTAHCVAAAAAVYRLPPAIIASILAVEGGQAGTRSRDADGSEDLGPAQINTVWLDEVAKAAGITRAEADRRLQWDGCFNIRVSGAILRHEIKDPKTDAVETNEALRGAKPDMAVGRLSDGGNGVGRQAIGPAPGLAIVLEDGAVRVERRSVKRPQNQPEHDGQPQSPEYAVGFQL